MQLAKINGGVPGWRRKMKIAIIYQLMVGKLMLVAPHFVSVVINLYSNAGEKDLLNYASYKINRITVSSEELFIHHTLTNSLEEAYQGFIN